MKKIGTSFNFDYQLMLTFGEDEKVLKISKACQYKWDKRNSHPSLALNIDGDYDFSKVDNRILKFINSIDDISKLRIYICGHSNKKTMSISNEEGDEYENKEIANFLALHLSKKTSKDNSVFINVIACYYGFGEFESGAADLQLNLSQQGIYAVVVARTLRVNVKKEDFEKLTFKKLTADESKKYIHKQPGTKAIFFTDEKGRQITKDAYEYLWKRETLIMLDCCQGNCIFPKKSRELSVLFQNIEKQTPAQALQTLEKLVLQKKSFIDDNDNFYSFFSSGPGTREYISQAIIKGRKVIGGKSLPTLAREP